MKRIAKHLLFLAMLTLSIANVASAEIWGYCDDDGACHFSNERKDGRYKKVRMWAGIYSNPDFDKGKYDGIIRQMSARYGVDFFLIKAVIKSESAFDRKAVSKAGAQGLMQLMPHTAVLMDVKNPFDPAQNIEGGVKYLKQQLETFNGNVIYAIAAYNAGPKAIEKYNGVPPYQETRGYVKIVLKNYKKYKKGIPVK